jgi:ATP-dependent exoDNAse (exonuclease V) alpha subunit
MADILSFFSISLNDDQKNTVSTIEPFLNNKHQNIFILKGHAGTGKTTLALGIIKYLQSKKTPFVLLASTGKAAKVLTDKTHHKSSTIHRSIYAIDEDTLNEENKTRKLGFKLSVNHDDPNTVYIVDESSMISDRPVKNAFIRFGSARLLSDLFAYINKRKIIFIGDPAQLPPVNNLFSAALNEIYIKKTFTIEAEVSSLQQIIRYKPNSGIGYNTKEIRDSIQRKEFPYLSVKASGYDDVKVYANLNEMVENYVSTIKRIGIDNTLFITLSNKEAGIINRMVRNLLFREKKSLFVNKGEAIMVMHNNYLHNLANGDIVIVSSVSPRFERKAGLTFRDAEVLVNTGGGQELIKCKIIDDLLASTSRDLTNEQDFYLIRDFMIRTKNKGIERKSEQFLEAYITDPYLNALRVKYGYAVTCHKAQGGEWQEVFIEFEKSMFFQSKENQYRWVYTAISRAEKKVHLLQNMCIY